MKKRNGPQQFHVLIGRTLTVMMVVLSTFLSSTYAQHDTLRADPPKLHQLIPFIDSIAKAGMASYYIPGAVIAIVTDSSHVYSNGYGFADLENQVPVDPDRTLFRIASITKTFTALAALQLVEKGKLSLHQDIRTYLPDDDFDFLSETPITLHQLLTHTAGFDLTDTRDAALKVEDVVSIEEMARRRMPDRVHQPGTVHSYSNFGYTLIGYLIQHVSGMAYEDYMIKNILLPLKMHGTGIHQPLPDSLRRYLAKSYEWDDEQVALTRDYTNTLPGGGIISNAKDMTNYMLMHLNRGQFEGEELVDAQTHRTMTAHQFGSRETKYGICYAFFENRWTGRRSIEHSGGQLGFVSLMILIPETGTGIFIAQNNRKNAGGYRYDMARTILDTLIGFIDLNIPPLVPSDHFDKVVRNYTGVYKQMAYPVNTFEKAVRLFGGFSTEYKIENAGNGRIKTYGDKYVMVDEHLFQRDTTSSTYKLEFLVDDTGKAQKLFIGTGMYERIGWWEKKRVQQAFLFVSMLILLFMFLSRPMSWLWRKVKKKELIIPAETNGLRQWLYWTSSALIVGILGIILHYGIFRDQLSDYGLPLSLKLVFMICTLGFILTLFSPFFLWKNWKLKMLNTWPKIRNTVVILACVILSIVFYLYNLIGLQHY